MRSIAKGLPPQQKLHCHFCSLPNIEVLNLLAKLDESSGADALALQFITLTAARSGKVPESHLGRDRPKGGSVELAGAALVPLSDLASEILKKANC